MPWIFQSNGLGICLRHKSAPSSKFASVPYPIHILHRPQQLKNPRHNLPKTVTQVSRFPRPRKAKTFANLQMLDSCKQFLWQTGNVQQGLPVAVNKEAAKGMCRHFLRSTRRDQKRLTAWFGQLRLTLSCDRVTVGDSPIWGGLRKDEMSAFSCQCTWVGTRAGIFWPSVPSNLRSDQKLNLSQKPTRFSLEMFN